MTRAPSLTLADRAVSRLKSFIEALQPELSKRLPVN